jgi:hypothetical protein
VKSITSYKLRRLRKRALQLSVIAAFCQLNFACEVPQAHIESRKYSAVDSLVSTADSSKVIAGYEMCDQDTLFIIGDATLFLRPDSCRFVQLEQASTPGVLEYDSDFGFAIAPLLDTSTDLKIKTAVEMGTATNRFILVEGCKDCPQLIDRDTLNYGLLMTSANKELEIVNSPIPAQAAIRQIMERYYGL